MKVQMLRQEIHCHLDLLLLTLTPGKERKEITVNNMPGVNVQILTAHSDISFQLKEKNERDVVSGS